MSVERIDWSRYALVQAFTATLRSEDPYTKVGACALDHSNRVLGLAYNGTKTNFKASEDFWIDRDKRRPYMIHAEANLLSLVKRDQCKMIAITHSPCAACATLIAAHNIEKVVYSISYEKDPKGLDILNFYNIKTEQIDFKDIHSIISSIILHKYSI